MLKQWVRHYNEGRPHMSLGPGLPADQHISKDKALPAVENDESASIAPAM
jgi:hypothetical protein